MQAASIRTDASERLRDPVPALKRGSSSRIATARQAASRTGSSGPHPLQAGPAGAVGAVGVGVIGPGSAVGQYDELFSGHRLPFLFSRMA